jgi:tRNA-dihydrouridine synthase B
MLSFQIGPYLIDPGLVLAPMAGVTDRPFRQLCKRLGAGLAASEMLSANPDTWHTWKSQLRREHEGEVAPIVVQIAGAEPAVIARAAQHEVAHGAAIIDINMGCPMKKVLNTMAGSALLSCPELVKQILCAVVQAVEVPVTLKIRTGPDPSARNGVLIAKIAEQAGIQALAVHGRTRACAFRGEAEYDTIAEIVRSVCIPVIANGDLDTPAKAKTVLERTGAAGLMFGRSAQGNPWIFREVAHFLATGTELAPPSAAEVRTELLQHVAELHRFYGPERGLKIARKHLGWYIDVHLHDHPLRLSLLRSESAAQQLEIAAALFGEDALAAA